MESEAVSNASVRAAGLPVAVSAREAAATLLDSRLERKSAVTAGGRVAGAEMSVRGADDAGDMLSAPTARGAGFENSRLAGAGLLVGANRADEGGATGRGVTGVVAGVGEGLAAGRGVVERAGDWAVIGEEAAGGSAGIGDFGAGETEATGEAEEVAGAGCSLPGGDFSGGAALRSRARSDSAPRKIRPGFMVREGGRRGLGERVKRARAVTAGDGAGGR